MMAWLLGLWLPSQAVDIETVGIVALSELFFMIILCDDVLYERFMRFLRAVRGGGDPN